MGFISITQVVCLINFWSAARKLPITFVNKIKDTRKTIGLKKSSYKSKPSVIWSCSNLKSLLQIYICNPGKIIWNNLKQNFADIFCWIYFYEFNPNPKIRFRNLIP